MKSTLKMLVAFACALPLATLAQTTPSAPPSDKTGATPTPGMESKKTTETGQSTTYPKSDSSSGMSKSAPSTDKEKNRITKGDAKATESPMSTTDPATTQKPAKEGSQSGPTK